MTEEIILLPIYTEEERTQELIDKKIREEKTSHRHRLMLMEIPYDYIDKKTGLILSSEKAWEEVCGSRIRSGLFLKYLFHNNKFLNMKEVYK